MTELKRCVKCTYPEAFETIAFDEHGACNICRKSEFRHYFIDWAARKEDLGACYREGESSCSNCP